MTKKVTTYKEKDDKPATPVVLLKFGQLEHLQDLLDNGILFVNSIQKIREQEGYKQSEDNYRNDPAEGAHEYKATGPGTMTLSALKGPDGNPLAIPYRNFTQFDKAEYVLGNICSFYGVTMDCFKNNELIPIDKRMQDFGPYFILIQNFDEFVKRIDLAVEKTIKMTWWYGYVTYFDEDTYTGKVSLFKKRSRFSFQKEFRTYFVSDQIEPIKINIGSLKDIATIIPSNIIEHFQIKMDPSGTQCNIRWPILKEPK